MDVTLLADCLARIKDSVFTALNALNTAIVPGTASDYFPSTYPFPSQSWPIHSRGDNHRGKKTKAQGEGTCLTLNPHMRMR